MLWGRGVSYICLATANFDVVTAFYRETLRAVLLDAWDRPGARGVRLDLYGLRLEILDAAREKRPLELPAPGDRLQLVVEVPDVDELHHTLGLRGTAPVTASWGARCFALRDPDGIPVNFLQWIDRPAGGA